MLRAPKPTFFPLPNERGHSWCWEVAASAVAPLEHPSVDRLRSGRRRRRRRRQWGLQMIYRRCGNLDNTKTIGGDILNCDAQERFPFCWRADFEVQVESILQKGAVNFGCEVEPECSG